MNPQDTLWRRLGALLLAFNDLSISWQLVGNNPKPSLKKPSVNRATKGSVLSRRRHGNDVGMFSITSATHRDGYTIISAGPRSSKAVLQVQCSSTCTVPSVRLALQQPSIGMSISLEAWVYRSQIHGKQLAFLKLGDGDAGGEYLSAMLQMPKQRVRLYAPGARIAIQGVMGKDDRGWLLHAHEVTLLRVAASLASIRRVLSAVKAGGLRPAEAKAAMCLGADAELPADSDTRCTSAILKALEKSAPSRVRDAAIGVLPSLPSAAHEPSLACLLSQGAMQRALAALEQEGGVAASAARLRSKEPEEDAPHGLIVVDGEVCGRRQLSDGFWVLDIRKTSATNYTATKSQTPQHCVLHASFGGDALLSYAAVAAVGASIRFVGIRPPHGNVPDVLLVSGARLLHSSTQLKAVRRLLSCVAEGSIDASEALLAVSVGPDGPDASPEAAVEFREALQAESHFERSWRASVLQRGLAAEQAVQQSLKEAPVHNLESTSKQGMHQLQRADSEGREAVFRLFESLRTRYPLRQLKLREDSQKMASIDRRGNNDASTDQLQVEVKREEVHHDRHSSVASPRNKAWRRPPGMLPTSSGTFWQAKKRPQLLLMTQVIADLLNARTSSKEAGGEHVRILDVGGGKGHLAQHLAERFGSRVNVTVVDLRWGLIAEASRRSQRSSGLLDNLHFVAGNASELLCSGALGHMDIIVGLHACGGLSDVILGHAVAHGAAFAVTTCCYLSHRHLRVQGGCGGVPVSRDEWLMAAASVDHAPLALASASLTLERLHTALHAAEEQKDPTITALGVHTVNAIRALAVEKHWARRLLPDSSDSDVAELRAVQQNLPQSLRQHFSVQLFSFNPKYSPRNTIMVGTPFL